MSDVRERHRMVGDAAPPRYREWCEDCAGDWPCDAIQQSDRADKAEAAFEAMDVHFVEAREVARELAAALRGDGIETVADVLRRYAENIAWPHSGSDPAVPVRAWADRVDAALARFDAEYGKDKSL